MKVEDLLSGEGPERRVDMERLVIYLARLDGRVDEMRRDFRQHATAEQEYQERVKELIDIMTQTKEIWKFVRGLVYIAAPIAGLIVWFREHFKW